MNVLITGTNGYIGNNLKSWLIKKNRGIEIDTISVRKSIPKDLSKYEAIVHLAAIVHKKEKSQVPKDYYNVNTLLTKELAQKAKHQGVKQFIFLSTMAVYGLEGEISKSVVIDEKTAKKPKNLYGKSKLAAEKYLKPLNDEKFKVAIIRAPIIYGENCPGNFKTLKLFAENTFISPKINNKRSMLHIDNLCELIFLLLENESKGIFYPQNKEYINTSDLVKKISEEKERRIIFSKILGKIIIKMNIKYTRKIFGNLVYDKKLSNHFDGKYMLKE